MLLTKQRSDSGALLIENSRSIMQEMEEYSRHKQSFSLIKGAIKVSMSINRQREYSKPIELTSWKNRLFLGFIVLLSISVGVVQVTQSGLNIALGIWLKNPLRSAFVSFVIGDLCLLPFYFLCNNIEKTEIISINRSHGDYNMNRISDSFSMSVSIFNPNTLQQEEVEIITPKMTCINMRNSCSIDKTNWIIIFNGALGVFFVCSVIYISPLIGFSLYYIAVVVGQISTSLLIDNFGLFWAFKKKVTCINLSGSILAIIGAVIFQMPGFIGATHSKYKYDENTVLYVIIALLSGLSLTIKSTLDRKLKKIMNGTAYQSTFVSFLNSTILLLIINIIVYYIEDDWFEVNNEQFEWWIFLGGILGPFIVTIYIIAPSYIGFVATFICAIFGSLITSFVFDITKAFGVDAHNSFTVWETGGMCAVLIGAIMVNIRRQQTVQKKKVKINDFSVSETNRNDQRPFDIIDDGTKYLALYDHDEDICSNITD